MSWSKTYTRQILGAGVAAGTWDINNGNHLDAGGKVIPLKVDIRASFTSPALTRIDSNAGQCIITFETEPTAQQITDLDAVVATYKAYTT